MRGAGSRLLQVLCAGCLLLAVLVGQTLCFWAAQSACNEFEGSPTPTYEVTLTLYERDTDGNETTNPLEGAEFYLYLVNPDDTLTQIGVRYLTDEFGQITVNLPPGDYCFIETRPLISEYTYDLDDGGNQIRRYDFTVTDGPLTLEAYNRILTGNLAIEKTVVNADAIPLTAEELAELLFTFTVTFDDGKSYAYKVNGGEVRTLASGGTLKLAHGDTAVFAGIPVGTAYTVVETVEPVPAAIGGYWLVSSSNHRGNVPAGGIAAKFTNTWADELPPPPDMRLTVRKAVAGDIPAEDAERAFRIVVTIDGTPHEIFLKHGEFETFEVPAGTVYEVHEDDYSPHGYFSGITNGFGTASGERREAVVTNTFAGMVMLTIGGEKTWDRTSDPAAPLPGSIRVRLLQGTTLVETATVQPDANGQWLYTFTVPKYGADGGVLAYTVVEDPLERWQATVDGYNIRNTYIRPAIFDPPVQKIVEGDRPTEPQLFRFRMTAQDGAPMPAGSSGSIKTVEILGAGSVEFGDVVCTQAGVYVYTFSELNTGAQGYIYDTSEYTLTVTVGESNNALVIQSYVWTKEGRVCDAAVFTNRYAKSGCPITLPPILPFPIPIPIPIVIPIPLLPCKPRVFGEKVTVCGQKTWEHGENNPADIPKEIIVLVLADGKTAVEKSITARDNWRWTFRLSKYDAQGREIVYTVDEKEVPGYEKEINGWDITNTWQPPAPPAAANPKTGDSNAIWLLTLPMLLSAAGLAVLGRRRREEEV